MRAVLRLEWPVFREIAADPHAFPQALVVVVGASALAGLGHGGPSRLALLGIAVSIVRWVIASALIWIAALIASDAEIDYPRLLRCTGSASPAAGAPAARSSAACSMRVGSRSVMAAPRTK